MVKKYFEDWNKFEKSFLICGLLTSIISSIIFNGTVIDTLLSLIHI